MSGVETASAGEIYLALKAGFQPKSIIFVGPGKTEEELAFAIQNDIQCIVIESMNEIKKINSISCRLKKTVSIALRVNPTEKVTGAKLSMSGRNTQFGVRPNDIKKIVEFVKTLQNIKIIGLHVYYGTQILDYKCLTENLKQIFEIANYMEREIGCKLEFVDFGGGFGVPYFKGEEKLDLGNLRREVSQLISDFAQKIDHQKVKFIVESGRFIIAECGYFITKIIDKKVIDDKSFVVVDGGANFHSTAANIGRFIRREFPVEVIRNHDCNACEIVNIVGPLCTPTDILSSNMQLLKIDIGDYIVFKNSEAYGLSASMTNFLSHITPSEILVNEDEEYIIRSRGNYQDLLLNQKLLF